KATVKPESLSNKSVTWSSSNTKVATVDKDGIVIGKSNGTTQITAKTSNNKTAKCTIKVSTNPTSIVLERSTLTLDGLREITLKATVNPSTATNKTINWSSSNTKVATVDKNGKIVGKSKGTATITAKTSNGKTDTCKVTVKDGYWEIKNNKYIYHYTDGTSREWSKSCYVSWEKIKDVKPLDPTLPKSVEKRKKAWTNTSFTYAGIKHYHYYCYDDTANNIAINNSGSPYAIAIDLDVANLHIYKRNNNKWEPDRTFTANVGSKSNRSEKQYAKSNTPSGLHYINGNRQPIAIQNDPCHYWVAFGADGHNSNNEDYIHYSGTGPKGDANGITGSARGTNRSPGCVTLSMERSKWIYYNIGRGTPVLIY
ncbi:MAG: Ig-like domain-containing protein, partial [Clostridia bacterium]|nr:Ig-like domain-containing protein [Clostridia bacterium]